jgi:hypothetical protein
MYFLGIELGEEGGIRIRDKQLRYETTLTKRSCWNEDICLLTILILIYTVIHSISMELENLGEYC